MPHEFYKLGVRKVHLESGRVATVGYCINCRKTHSVIFEGDFPGALELSYDQITSYDRCMLIMQEFLHIQTTRPQDSL